MFTHIVVPLDGSELAERALPVALAVGRAAHSEIRLVRAPVFEQMLVPASEGFGVVWPNQSYEQTLNTAQEYLEHIRLGHAASPAQITTEIVEGEGDVAGAIVEAATAVQAGVIVMSTHGYSGITRWVLGSVTERVLHHAPCPIYVARVPELPRQMLIPLDGSELAETALVPALELAGLLGCRVTLLRAVPTVSAEEVHRLNAIEPGIGARLQEDLCTDAARYLEHIVAMHARPDLSLGTKVMIGPAAYTIIKYAELEGFDVIAMATHGRTGLRRWAYGSVMEKVLRSAACSLLVVRPEAHRPN